MSDICSSELKRIADQFLKKKDISGLSNVELIKFYNEMIEALSGLQSNNKVFKESIAYIDNISLNDSENLSKEEGEAMRRDQASIIVLKKNMHTPKSYLSLFKSVYLSDENAQFPLALQERNIHNIVSSLSNNELKDEGTVTISIDGATGSGKTTFVSGNAIKIHHNINKNHKKVLTTAVFSAKARSFNEDVSSVVNKNNMSELSGENFRSVYYSIKRKLNQKKELDFDILMIDEATLLDNSSLNKLKLLLKNKGVDIILIGDSLQPSFTEGDPPALEDVSSVNNSSVKLTLNNPVPYMNQGFRTSIAPISNVGDKLQKGARAYDSFNNGKKTSSSFELGDLNSGLIVGHDSHYSGSGLNKANLEVGIYGEKGNASLLNDKDYIDRLEQFFKDNPDEQFRIAIVAENNNSDLFNRFSSYNNIKIIYFNVNSYKGIQGDEVDFAFMDMPDFGEATDSSKQKYLQSANMLITRAKYFTNIGLPSFFNFTSIRNRDGEFNEIDNVTLKRMANDARKVYKEAYADIDGAIVTDDSTEKGTKKDLDKILKSLKKAKSAESIVDRTEILYHFISDNPSIDFDVDAFFSDIFGDKDKSNYFFSNAVKFLEDIKTLENPKETQEFLDNTAYLYNKTNIAKYQRAINKAVKKQESNTNDSTVTVNNESPIEEEVIVDAMNKDLSIQEEIDAEEDSDKVILEMDNTDVSDDTSNGIETYESLPFEEVDADVYFEDMYSKGNSLTYFKMKDVDKDYSDYDKSVFKAINESLPNNQKITNIVSYKDKEIVSKKSKFKGEDYLVRITNPNNKKDSDLIMILSKNPSGGWIIKSYLSEESLLYKELSKTKDKDRLYRIKGKTVDSVTPGGIKLKLKSNLSFNEFIENNPDKSFSSPFYVSSKSNMMAFNGRPISLYADKAVPKRVLNDARFAILDRLKYKKDGKVPPNVSVTHGGKKYIVGIAVLDSKPMNLRELMDYNQMIQSSKGDNSWTTIRQLLMYQRKGNGKDPVNTSGKSASILYFFARLHKKYVNDGNGIVNDVIKNKESFIPSKNKNMLGELNLSKEEEAVFESGEFKGLLKRMFPSDKEVVYNSEKRRFNYGGVGFFLDNKAVNKMTNGISTSDFVAEFKLDRLFKMIAMNPTEVNNFLEKLDSSMLKNGFKNKIYVTTPRVGGIEKKGTDTMGLISADDVTIDISKLDMSTLKINNNPVLNSERSNDDTGINNSKGGIKAKTVVPDDDSGAKGDKYIKHNEPKQMSITLPPVITIKQTPAPVSPSSSSDAVKLNNEVENLLGYITEGDYKNLPLTTDGINSLLKSDDRKGVKLLRAVITEINKEEEFPNLINEIKNCQK